MTKPHAKFDRNPFIPAQSNVCRMADKLMMFSVAFFGLSAAIIAFIKQLGAVS
jgi:hypothetical protein